MKKRLSLLLVVIMLLSLCACGSMNDSSRDESYKQAAYSEPAYAPAAAESSANGFMMADSSGAESAYESRPEENNDKIIYSSEVTVETTEFDKSIDALNEMISKYDGWVESSSMNGSNLSSIQKGYAGNRTARYTIRVPSKNFATIMGSFSNIGNVPYSYTYTENISARYYDTQARLNSYKAQEQQLIELLDKAETVSDVIEIQNALTDVRYNIESMETTIRSWDRQVAYSSISLSVNEVSEYTPEAKRSYWSKLGESFSSGFESLKYFFLGVVEALPTLIFIALIVWAVIAIICGMRRAHPEREQKRRERAEMRKAEKLEKKRLKEAAKAESPQDKR